MKITVSVIPPQGLSLPFSLDEAWLEKAFGEFGDKVTCSHPVHVFCEVRKTGSTVVIQGSVTTQLVLPCARCLEPAELNIDTEFRYVMVPQPSGYGSDVELSPEDIEYGYYAEDCIDLLPLVYEQISLQIPMVVLCREDCKGICPHCGRNLNLGPCSCREDEVDIRWSVLKNLRIEKR